LLAIALDTDPNIITPEEKARLEKLGFNDTIVFGEGITQENISVTLVGSDVVITLNENDSLTIKNATTSNSSVENIQLSDGTILKIKDLQNATEFNDNLTFGNTSVTLDALGGDDRVTTGSGDDVITGGSGDDTIRTNDGDDTLNGGSGSDTLIAGRVLFLLKIDPLF